MDNDAWLMHFEAIEFAGLLRSVANFFVLESADEHSVLFSVDPAQAKLLNPQHHDQVAQALSAYVGTAIKVTIELKSSPLPSPESHRAAQQQQQQQQALQSMRDDPVVHAMSEQYGAELLEHSVKLKS